MPGACSECDAGKYQPHHPACSQSPLHDAAVDEVSDMLMRFVCAGGGDGETIRILAQDIVSVVRHNKETA